MSDTDDDKTLPLDPVDADETQATKTEADETVTTKNEATETLTAGTATFGAAVTEPAQPAADAASAPLTVPITADAAPTAHARPRIRWAAIVWGLIIAGIAATTFAIVGTPERRQAVSDWVATLTPGAFWILSVLLLGVFILVLALLTLIRRAQNRRSVV